MGSKEIRHENLRHLVAECGSIAGLARTAGVSEKYVRQILGGFQGSRDKTPRQVGDDFARKLERGCQKPSGWMDVPHDDALPDSAQAIIDATRKAVAEGRLTETDARLVVSMIERMTGVTMSR